MFVPSSISIASEYQKGWTLGVLSEIRVAICSFQHEFDLFFMKSIEFIYSVLETFTSRCEERRQFLQNKSLGPLPLPSLFFACKIHFHVYVCVSLDITDLQHDYI